jgi:single-strand DNA-binding protein
MNKVFELGHIGNDLELKATSQANVSFVSFSLTVKRQFKNAQDEYETDWFTIIAYRNLAENLCKYQSKGSKVLVEGRLQVRTYEVDGQTKYVTEIIAEDITFLDSKKTVVLENVDTKPEVEIPSGDDTLPF